MIRLRALGQCVIEVGDTRLTPAAETLFATALYLVLEGGRPISRRELVELLWPGVGERPAHHRLRQTLYKLDSMGAGLRGERTHVVLPPRSLHADCAALLEARDAAAMESLAEDAAGAFLPGYAPRFSRPFTEWLERQRDIINSALRRALVAGIVARKTRADWPGAERLAVKCLSIDPLNEEATLAMAEAAAMHGSKAHALATLDRYLRDIGPEAREIRLPAMTLRRRIAEMFDRDVIPPRSVPLIGRDDEMAVLTHALQLATSGHGSAYHVWGEPGIGKTRLATEFLRRAVLQHAQVAQVGCQSHDERRPLSAFVDLVPKLLALPGSIGCSPESMKYLKRLVEHDPTAVSPSPDSRESEFLFASIRRSLFDLLDAIASEGCLVILIEDVHWLDPMSWTLLWDAASWVAARQMLILLTSRSAETPGRATHAEAPAFTLLPLAPLHDAASQELLEAVTAGTDREGNEAFRDWCVAAAGGNPYYLTELALHASYHDGIFRAPATLSKLIGERLARLSRLAKRILQACCVLGKFSSLDRLDHVLGERRIDLLDGLDELEQMGLVEANGTRISIKHDLLCTAVLNELSELSSALLHRHAALALEAEVATNQSTTILWECAEHWQQAGERERAISLLRRCARHSLEMGLPAEAARLLERAMELAGGAESESGEVLPILQERIGAMYIAGEWRALGPLLETASQLEKQHGLRGHEHDDNELLAIDVKWRTGSALADLVQELRRCVTCANAAIRHRVRAATLGLMFADNMCASSMGAEFFAQVASLLNTPDVSDSARYSLLLVYHSCFGDLDEGVDAANRLIEYERKTATRAALSRSLRYASVAYERAGLMSEAIAAATEAFQIAKECGMPSHAAASATRLARIHAQLDDLATAEEWIRRALGFVRHDTALGTTLNIRSERIQLALQQGAYDEAESLLKDLPAPASPADLRPYSHVMIYKAAIQAAKGGTAIAKDDAEKLFALHEHSRTFADHDRYMILFADVCKAANLRDRFSQVLADYLTRYRRERSPIPARLRRFLPDVTQPDHHDRN